MHISAEFTGIRGVSLVGMKPAKFSLNTFREYEDVLLVIG